ncbi:ribonuclease HII [Glutamicibacter sp. X7]
MAGRAVTVTTLEHELALAAAHQVRYIGAVDEVGRGALAGPISVGATVLDTTALVSFPELRDSKLLSAAKRESFVEEIRSWAVGYGVGHASAQEVDDLGVTAALRLAGTRALAACAVAPEAILLDGSYDWLTTPESNLLDLLAPPTEESGVSVPVRTIIKGDMQCQGIAGASILAKVERDALMECYAAEFPVYGWSENKGYATASHRQAIAEHGACHLHRRSWNLT